MRYTDYFKEIARASKSRRLVFFVGAGVSRLSGYPSWEELISVMHEELYRKPAPKELSSEECLRIAQVFYDSMGKAAYDQVLEREFGVQYEPNSIHWKMLALNPTHFITTNYDSLIERVCAQRGRNFKVISSDRDVANVHSPGYILKIHGDFKDGFDGDSIVLKENDYLNYELQYPLVINLVKTILATHTVVFIGYGLGDYNVKYMLSWVKQLQGKDFSSPFFIETRAHQFNEHEIAYYTSKGLRIIESADLIGTTKAGFANRYAIVLDGILGFRDNAHLISDEEIINYLWHKIAPLGKLRRVRKKDLSILFDGDYYFESSGAVYRVQNTGPQYLERFFEMKQHGVDIENDEAQIQFHDISKFFDKNGVVGMADQVHQVNPPEIYDPVFHARFGDMETLCSEPGDDLEMKYRKAFYLANFGRWQEAYELYSQIISETSSTDYLHYYLSQLNRYWLYLSVERYSLKFLRLIPGLLTAEFYERIQREMRNFDVDHLFGEMPYEFQEKYPFLESLSSMQFSHDTVKLYELITATQDHMKKGSYTFGWSTELDLWFTTNDTLAFLYDNCIWFSSYAHIKQFTRNSLLLRLEKAYYDMTRDVNEFAIFRAPINFSLSYHDFVMMTISLTIDDVRSIEKSYGASFLRFDEQADIEAYLVRLAEAFVKHHHDANRNHVFRDLIFSRVRLGCYLTRHLRLSETALNILLRLMLYPLQETEPHSHWYVYIERMALGSGLYDSSIDIIENYIVENLGSSCEKISVETLSRYGNLIKHFKRDYISPALSSYALKANGYDQLATITHLYALLSPEAQRHVLGLKGDKIGSISELLRAANQGLVSDLADYQDMINDYLAQYMENKKRERERGVISLDCGTVTSLAICFFLGKLRDPTMKRFVGVVDEYDMFVEPESFDFENKFNPAWLKTYNNGLLHEIATNKHMRPHVLAALKEKVMKTNDKEYARIVLDHFLLGEQLEPIEPL